MNMEYEIYDAEGDRRFSDMKFTCKEEAQKYARWLEEDYGKVHPREYPCRIVEIDE